MDAIVVPIAVAVIGGPMMWLLHRLDRRNSEQHGANMAVLERIEDKVERVDERLSDHIDWHLEKK